MSVSDVMNTMMTQDSTATMSADVTSTSMPSGSDGGKPNVGGIDDIMNLYSESGDDTPSSSNGVELKEDKSNLPDELNNVVEGEKNTEEKKEVEAETSADVIKESTTTPENVKVKINGVETEVPLKDVINSYSGQQEIQRRFTEFDKTKRAFESEKNDLVGMNDYVKQEIGDLRQSFSSTISQYEKTGYLDKNPLEAVNQLLDKMGINSNLFQRAVFEHQLPEYAKFFNMTETERDAHQTKQENEYLRRKEQGFTERDQQVKLREEDQRNDFQLIKNAGLDSVKYESLASELADAGHKNITAKNVVEYAKQKPALDKVVEVFNKLGVDPLNSDKTKTVFKLFTDYPDTTVEEILDSMDSGRAALKSAKILNEKTQNAVKVPSHKSPDADMDEMLNYYKN